MASMAAAALAYLWLGFASELWMLFAARALAGICAGNIAAAQAYIADVTPPEKRARGMGMIGAAFGLGFIIGPALGGLVAGNEVATADLESPGLIAAGLSAVAFLGVVLRCRSLPAAVRRGRGAAGSPRSTVLGRPVLARLLVVFSGDPRLWRDGEHLACGRCANMAGARPRSMCHLCRAVVSGHAGGPPGL
jgi:MFS family permease